MDLPQTGQFTKRDPLGPAAAIGAGSCVTPATVLLLFKLIAEERTKAALMDHYDEQWKDTLNAWRLRLYRSGHSQDLHASLD